MVSGAIVAPASLKPLDLEVVEHLVDVFPGRLLPRPH